MSLKFKRFDSQTYAAVFFLLFGLVFVRYCYFGFEYYLQLDDYIQYHNYTAYNTDLGELISKLGMLSSRPLAGICDLFVWSHFYSSMIWALAIISAMYAASGVFLHRVFSSRFGTGWLFFVVYALLPIAFEGTYWISASSRIIVGLFFAALALLCFDEWCEKGSKLRLTAFIVLQLIAFCFYEQVVLFSGAATLIIMLCNIKSHNHRALWGFSMFANAAIYFIITKLAPSGVYGSRGEMLFPWQEGYVEHLFLPAGEQMREVLFKYNAATLSTGLLRGVKLLFTNPNFICILVMLALCTLLFLLARSVKRSRVRILPELLSGVLLAAAPLALFFVLKDPWFGARNIVTSLCGFALICDALLDFIFGRLKKGAAIEAAIVAVLALLCCIASVSELRDYREVTLADTAVSKAAADAFEGHDFAETDNIWIFNVDASYVDGASFYFHEHGYGVTSSDWALTGAIRAISGRKELPIIRPISSFRTESSIAEDTIVSAKTYFYKDGRVIPVALKKTGSGAWNITDSGSNILGNLNHSENDNLELFVF